MVAPPTHTYLDQLISETWVKWSEKYLQKQQSPNYTTSKGWQDYVKDVDGTVNSNERTRAKELYECGFLRGPLVNRRESRGSNNVPEGWNLIQNDHHAHTKLGYTAYAIGKAISENHRSTNIIAAMSVIAAIIILQKGFVYQGRYILLVSVFEHIRKSFPRPNGVNENTWNRWLAATMFCTLNDNSNKESLVGDTFTGTTTNTLTLSPQNAATLTIDRDSLLGIIQNNGSLNEYNRAKAPLYWIGNPEDNVPRGIYTIAVQTPVAEQLLRESIVIEHDTFVLKKPNPFETISPESLHHQETPCVIQILSNIYSEKTETQDIWENAMKTLHRGVLEALESIAPDQSNILNSQRTLYAHKVEGNSIKGQKILVSVPKSQCATKPSKSDVLVIKDLRYTIIDVTEDGDNWKISVE